MSKKISFDAEELERAISTGSIYHSLNNDRIRDTIEFSFGKDKAISDEWYQKIIEGNYIDFDLEKHGFPNLLGDMKLLTELLQQSIHIAKSTTKNISNAIGFIGCGPGRNAIAVIELAKKLGIREILFNDLLDKHVQITEDKIAKEYGTRKKKIDGVKLNFVVGDFVEVSKKIRKRYDALFAWWFVTSEIADFSSVEKLRQRREELFRQIKKLLTKQGVFVEDIPHSEGVATYYYLGRLKTYAILHEMGILEGENNHILATNFGDIQQTGCYHHVRYVPSNGKHRKELANAGFQEHCSKVVTLPNAVKNPDKYLSEFGDSSKIREFFAGNALEDIVPYLTQKEFEFLTYPLLTHPMSQQKKIILWRQMQND